MFHLCSISKGYVVAYSLDVDKMPHWVQCLKSSVNVLEEAGTLWSIESAFYVCPFFLLGLFLVYVILVDTSRCGGSDTCLKNMRADT